jgi:hypothetical protein
MAEGFFDCNEFIIFAQGELYSILVVLAFDRVSLSTLFLSIVEPVISAFLRLRTGMTLFATAEYLREIRVSLKIAVPERAKVEAFSREISFDVFDSLVYFLKPFKNFMSKLKLCVFDLPLGLALVVKITPSFIFLEFFLFFFNSSPVSFSPRLYLFHVFFSNSFFSYI